MTLLFFVLLLLVRFASRVHGAQTFSPAAIPYAVRTPYLNTWMNTPVNSNIPSDWPTFWGGQITGWIFYIQVDGKTYSLFGTSAAQGNDSVTAGALLETELTPTRTIHVLEAGHMNVTLTFLSPITPSDLVRQSLPFTYLAVDLASTDGQPHSVQLYSDITGEWLSGDRSQEMTWSPPTQTGDMIYHQLKLVTSSAFQENGHQAVDGTAYYAMGLEQGRNITWQTCPAGPCREEFISGGGVNANENDSTNRAINNDYPAFAISVNLGNVSSVNSHIVWVVGYVRDPNIDYTLSGNTTSLRPYYTTNFSTIESALEFVVADFNNSLTQAMAFDADIQSAASEISPQGELYDMLSLATRQVFSSLEITAPYQIGQTGGATRIFMKDLGITRRVTPVETLYAALPMFLYFNNGSLVKPLLVPLLEQQNVSISRYPSAAKDLGETFPAVTGPNLVSQEGIEQTGNMLIIALAHARYSNDTSLLLDYYALFKNWALYLTDNNNALYPNDQTSIDDGSTSPNSTNLAVKGIFAIQAMAEISQLVGQTNDSQRFSSIASSLIGTWQSLALSPGDGTVLVTYAGQPASWVLPYNLYVQTLLGFNLVNQTIFDKLTVTYGQWIGSPSNGYTYGLPIESSESSPGNAAWNAFVAATATNDTVRDQLITAVWNYASDNTGGTPFGVLYDVDKGTFTNGSTSPALGGLFAPFLRSGTVAISTSEPAQPASTSTSNDSSGSHIAVGAIAGGVVGGVVGLLVLLGLALFLLRRRKVQKSAGLLDVSGTRTEPTPFASAPLSSAYMPDVIMTEKRRRELQPQREGEPLLLSTSVLSSPAGGDPPPGNVSTPSMTSDQGRGRQDDLLGLRTDIEDLRRIMLNVHIERPEPSDLGAPPVYS